MLLPLKEKNKYKEIRVLAACAFSSAGSRGHFFPGVVSWLGSCYCCCFFLKEGQVCPRSLKMNMKQKCTQASSGLSFHRGGNEAVPVAIITSGFESQIWDSVNTVEIFCLIVSLNFY